ncbi:MAG: HEAT repeat domain-containing protein, partial [Phycisphaerae bacterium]|nr:HEAT repeat domain-containing protein [Phycisphaerae bacterium]
MNERRLSTLSTAVLLPALLLARVAPGDVPAAGPYARQVAEQTAALKSSSPHVRGGAAESLGYLRAWAAAGALADALADPSPVVRREAAMSLGWCGGRSAVKPLLAALDDKDWTVRQAACVALTNLTGMEFPFDALAEPSARQAQARKWRHWWAKAPADRPPKDVLALLGIAARPADNLALGCKVSVSSTYRGPASVLTDGSLQQGFWQTKNVPFPQHCTVDLGQPKKFACVVVQQYGSGFCMTDFAVSTSADGRTFQQVLRRKATTPPRLVVTFPPATARYVRITSYGSERSAYPTTFREVEVWAKAPSKPAAGARSPLLRTERGLRALGALGGAGASEAVAKTLGPLRAARGSFADKALIQTGIRALGRLRGPKALPTLTAMLDNPQWARYAADALGDLGGPKAEAALLAAYPRYARNLAGRNPKQLPRDDRPGLDPRDRMYETPYAIASALARLPLTDEKNLATLREIAPLLVANMPSDYDGAMLYEQEAWMLVTAHLLERAGVRQAACDAAFAAFGRPRKNVPKVLAGLAGKRAADVPYAAIWLPALCRNKTDTPDLIALLEHNNGWVRINAAKALMFLGDRRAIGPITKLLAASKPESAYGYFGGFLFGKALQGHDEYNDPAPRWREALIRALGRLGAVLPFPYLTDDRSTLGIQYAAALTLDELGTPEALAELKRTEATHPYHSIRLVAREALWRRGLLTARIPAAPRLSPPAATASPAAAHELDAVVFIKGDNNMPNDFQIDPWRQTYSTTDSGPTYRLGRNLYVLRPAGPGGKAAPLTSFTDGYVADCEVSWDGRRVVFARRGGSKDP